MDEFADPGGPDESTVSAAAAGRVLVSGCAQDCEMSADVVLAGSGEPGTHQSHTIFPAAEVELVRRRSCALCMQHIRELPERNFRFAVDRPSSVRFAETDDRPVVVESQEVALVSPSFPHVPCGDNAAREGESRSRRHFDHASEPCFHVIANRGDFHIIGLEHTIQDGR